MKHTLTITITGICLCIAAGLSTLTAEAQAPTPVPSVWLQSSNPGTMQTGNLNVSGNVKAGTLQGSGALITGVNADLLDGINSTAFLTAVPNPLSLSGSSAGSGVIRGTNTSTADNASGVYGAATASLGITYGVHGVSNGDSGAGVYGEALSSFGVVYGGYFRSTSPIGRGVGGFSSSGDFGGLFFCGGNGGVGVYGSVSSGGGANFGVAGESPSPSGTGVDGLASSTAGTGVGVNGASNSAAGIGVRGTANGSAGAGVRGSGVTGVWAHSSSLTGTALYSELTSASSTGIAVHGSAVSNSATGGLFQNGLGGTYAVEIAGPNGAVNTGGFVYREYTASTRSAAIPIAYGCVNSDGTIAGGTGNFTVVSAGTGAYDITIANEAYSNSNCATSVTATGSQTPKICVTANNSGVLRVAIYNLAGTAINNQFQFIVYKSNPDELGLDGDGGAPENNGGTGKITFKRLPNGKR